MPPKDRKTAALTGGIASGKSIVTRMFQELGAYVIDADLVARQIVEPGQPAWIEIVEHFGPEILLENNRLNRKRLGSIIFQQPEKRLVLNRITHPRVIEEINHLEQHIRETERNRVILIDVPLLIEASMHNEYATIIVVYVSEKIQLQRLMDRDHISEDSARQKISSQMPLSEKLSYATYIINNNETLDKTKEQVIAVYRQFPDILIT